MQEQAGPVAEAVRRKRMPWFRASSVVLAELIRSYFETIGVERDRIPDPFGLKGQREAAEFLYDP